MEILKLQQLKIPNTRHFSLSLEKRWILIFASRSLRNGALYKLPVVDIDGEAATLRHEITTTNARRDCRPRGRTRIPSYGPERFTRIASIGDGIRDLKLPATSDTSLL